MSIQVSIGLNTEKNPLHAAQTAARQALLNLKEAQASLAIVFSSVEFAKPEILAAIIDILGPVPLVGCSSLAVIANQGIFKYGILIALFSLPEGTYLNTACVEEIDSKNALEAGRELGDKLLYGFKNIRRNFALLFSDGLMRNASTMLEGLQRNLGMSFPLLGGSASDELSFKKTYIYFNQQVLSGGACGILWGGKLNFGLGIRHGWKPLGKPRHITKSVGNIVYEIDGKSATNVYEEYFARDLSGLQKDSKKISILYPIGIYLPEEKGYLLRNITSIEDNGSLVFQGNVPEGSSIRLMIGTNESCLAATKDALDEAGKNLAKERLDFLLVFESVSRYLLLGRQIREELQLIENTVGKNTPLFGICTYGEQAPLRAINYQGKAHFHNQTIALLAAGA
ncbi:MAG: FIST N-terminal domain-containing protein [Candidatus Omnitrophota bacterium]